MTEDSILLEAMARDSVKAFDELYRKYAPRVGRFASSLLLSSTGFGQADADDLTQEIFLKVWQKREALAGSVENFNAYLFRMTKNAVLNLICRKRSVNVAIEEDAGITDNEEAVLKTLVAEVFEKVKETVDSMPAERREVYVLSREEGLPNKEIAARLKISLKTVEYHIGRALSDIKKNLI